MVSDEDLMFKTILDCNTKVKVEFLCDESVKVLLVLKVSKCDIMNWENPKIPSNVNLFTVELLNFEFLNYYNESIGK